ncbi:electron transfer flavoprotein subunit beta/FixA family protein [Pseudarthrobacter sulfonivorans]|uniref:electron transfer flavoprotein subunit beta/FixA family protein n=1 Tax=Pseudarthrobacter sulfonivorans TaxID=121292 RepID=UPI002783EBFB|nr:electron transfer flavoprotein subunit beta/FixA family protein [Pseudarthrobacter sulfonivorans]MDP9998430.1 electron transfer flavoprotein beta subunit [Pseudarthrobacter sulfonivorans]
MKIVVLIKQVPDTEETPRLDPATGRLDRDGSDRVLDEINERALEVALRRKDADKKATEVVVVSMGPSNTKEALRKALSMGADSAVHIEDEVLEGADAGMTARVLAAALKQLDFDLVVAGNQSTDGAAGIVPAMVAEYLGLPLLSSLDTVELDEDFVRGEHVTETATLTVSAPLPAVISLTERIGEARFPSFKGIMGAKRKPIETLSAVDLGIAPSTETRRTWVLEVTERAAKTAGTKIANDGDAGAQLADFLVARQLV